MIPTFVGISLIFFFILQLAPGGPLEQDIRQFSQNGQSDMGSGCDASQELSPKTIEQLKKFYGFDRPIIERYLLWLGLWPRHFHEKEISPGDSYRVHLSYAQRGIQKFEIQKWVRLVQDGNQLYIVESAIGGDFAFDNYVELPRADKIKNWYPSRGWKIIPIEEGKYRVYKQKLSGIIQGNFGVSYVFRKPVSEIIANKLPISAYFGLVGFLLSYFISIPLGIKKAVHHKSLMDTTSSIMVFIGYSIPGFALGLLLLVLLAGSSFLNIFPLGGFHSLNWDELSFFGKIIDQVYHTILPIIAWSIGSFATLTILMKNSLIENLSQDYVRTAFAKGLSEKRVIMVHALRNSLIPIATNIGRVIGVIFAGSYLIEKTFNIAGLGLLSLNSLIFRDYPISLAFMVISTIIALIGNLISDIVYATIDPRIRFK